MLLLLWPRLMMLSFSSTLERLARLLAAPSFIFIRVSGDIGLTGRAGRAGRAGRDTEKGGEGG